ncbi:MAG TPA: trigger factor [Candidatus Binataceae bacterium]|nr:trigger factor [Candidatus Binataceae bacterium]
MQVNIDTPSALRRKLTIEVEADEIKRELDSAYNELKRGVVLKGFRPGRAPRTLLERFFGDQVRGEVVQKLVRQYTEKALEENALKPVVAPEIVTEETDLAKTLKFSATFDLRPELVVKDYEGLKIPEFKAEVKEEEIDRTLESLRERQATLKKIEGRTNVADGDYVLASVEGFDGDKPLSGVPVQERLLLASKTGVAHQIDEILIGAEVGKPARGIKSYAQDYTEKELAGKTVEWRVSAKEIYERILPNLDDEFAKDQGDCKDLAELRVRVREELDKHAREEADSRARQGLLDLVIERNPVELPESLVAREQRMMEQELHNTLEAGGIPHEQVEERVKASSDELKQRAEKRARTSLVVDAIAEQEKIEVSDEELGDRVAQFVTQAGRNRDRAAEFYRDEANREGLRITMRREKALDLVMARAQREQSPAAATEPADKS